MKYVGAHVSASNGIENTIYRAKKVQSTALSFFTKNQLRWKSSALDKESIKKFKLECEKFNLSSQQIIPHASYLINLGNPTSSILEKSKEALIDEINRCNSLGLSLLNFHPGNHLNKVSENECLKNISSSINYVLKKTNFVKLVIENTAGQGTSVGYKFEHLATIIKNVHDKSRIGICIDTCHLFSSGYDIRTEKSFNETFFLFNKIIGFNYLTAIHLNDSKTPFNSRIDRHQNLGIGYIGKTAFSLIAKDKRFKKIPVILETPNPKLWKKEINWIKSIE